MGRVTVAPDFQVLGWSLHQGCSLPSPPRLRRARRSILSDTELEFHKMEELWAQMVLMVTERVNGPNLGASARLKW